MRPPGRLLAGAEEDLPVFSGVKASGTKSVVLWLPSQKGCFAERPHVHQ